MLYEFVDSEHWKRDNINFWLPFLTFGKSTFSLLKVPSNNIMNQPLMFSQKGLSCLDAQSNVWMDTVEVNGNLRGRVKNYCNKSFLSWFWRNCRPLRWDTLGMKLLGISFGDHITNDAVRYRIRQAIGPYDDILTAVKKRKLIWACIKISRVCQDNFIRNSARREPTK